MKLNWLILLVACGAVMMGCPAGDDDDDADFIAGQFDFETVGVDDACMDGALAVLYMPEGEGTPSPWAYPIELPACADTPADTFIELQDPFNNMDVVIDCADSTFTISGEENLGVEIDADTYPDCTVDYTIDAEIGVIDADNLTGTVTLSTGNWTGENCPAVSADPCDVTLDVEATRK